MNVSIQPAIEIWFDGMEYGYRIDFQDEYMCELVNVEPIVEGKSPTYNSAVATALSQIRSYANKLKSRENSILQTELTQPPKS